MEAVAPEDWPCGSLTTVVDVDQRSAASYDGAVRLWFELMAQRSFSDLLRRHRAGDDRVTAFVCTVWRWHVEEDREVFGEGSLDRVLDQVGARGFPELLLLAVAEESDNGFRVPGMTGDCFLASLRVRCSDDQPGWMQFSATGAYWSTDLIAPSAVQRQWCDAVERFALATTPVFANVTDDNDAGPALDSALNRSETESVANSRTILRGYSWVTICGPELVDRLGGVKALEASDAFWRVDMLDSGAVWLQATEQLQDYDSEAIGRVFKTLAPVLPDGMVEPVWGNAWPRLVHDDASRYR